MSSSTTSSIECSLFGSPNSDQILIVRFGFCRRLISRSPAPEIVPHVILQQIPSTHIREALFSLSNLSDPGQQQSIEFLVNEFLRSFNLRSSACQMICHNILSFAQQYDTNNEGFKIEANIEYIKEFWMEAASGLYSIPMMGEEGFEEVPPTGRRGGAPESAIERLKKQKFDGFNGDEEEEEEEEKMCSVCQEDVKRAEEKEVSRIPCGHVYHKSCILTWLKISNSCPLCRTPLEA